MRTVSLYERLRDKCSKEKSRKCSHKLAVGGEHAVAVTNLPPLHRDPFDRVRVAQSIVEGITLLTADPRVAQYPGPVRRV